MKVVDFVRQIKGAVKSVGGENIKIRFKRKKGDLKHCFYISIFCDMLKNGECKNINMLNYICFFDLAKFYQRKIDYWEDEINSILYHLSFFC